MTTSLSLLRVIGICPPRQKKEIRTLFEINKLSGDSLSFYFKSSALESVPPYFVICGPVAYSLSLLLSSSPSTQFKKKSAS